MAAPFAAGDDQVTVTEPAPAEVAVTVGAFGGAAGVAATDEDGPLVPMAFVADTENE